MSVVGHESALFGCGRMGGVVAQALIDTAAAGDIPAVIDPSPSDQALAMARSGCIALNPDPSPARLVILAIKPQDFEAARSAIAAWIGPDTTLISIMAGIGSERLAAAFAVSGVVRVMPNLVGVSAWCRRGQVNEQEITRLLASMGMVEGPVAEELMDAVTALSGCGPAYLFLLCEAMQTAGEALGLDKALAASLTEATLRGASEMLRGADAAELIAAVASPGGATEAALAVMRRKDIPAGIEVAMRAARDRSRELAAQI